MPIRPRFTVAQDDTTVTFAIHVPYVRVGDAEIHVEGFDFSFWCKPFLLNLTMPHEIVDADGATAVYDPDQENGTMTVKVLKAEPGQHFPDLDLVTKLLQPKSSLQQALGDDRKPNIAAAPLIEVIDSEYNRTADGSGTGGADGDGEPRDGATAGAGEGAGAGAGTGAGAAVGAGDELADAMSALALGPPKYGFNNAKSGVFRNLGEETVLILELPQPDRTPASQRHEMRIQHEESVFDGEAYQADFCGADDDYVYQAASAFTPFWTEEAADCVRAFRSGSIAAAAPADGVGTAASPAADTAAAPAPTSAAPPPPTPTVSAEAGSATAPPVPAAASPASAPVAAPAPVALEIVAGGLLGNETVDVVNVLVNLSQRVKGELLAGYSEQESEWLQKLPNKEYLIAAGSAEESRLLSGLVDILFAYAYDNRFTQGDPNAESPWACCTLSPTLSWFDAPSTSYDALVGGIRRALIYPYLRVWSLVAQVANDVVTLLACGRRSVLRCLLRLRDVLMRDDNRYLLNTLYIEDYAIWVQHVSGERFNRLTCDVAAAARRLHKGAVGLPLVALEREVMEAVMGFDNPADAAGSSSSSDGDSDSGTSDSDDASEDGSSSDDDTDGDDSGDEEDDTAAPARASATARAVPAAVPPAAGADAGVGAGTAAVELLTGEPTSQGGALRHLSSITAPVVASAGAAPGAHHPGIVVVEDDEADA